MVNQSQSFWPGTLWKLSMGELLRYADSLSIEHTVWFSFQVYTVHVLGTVPLGPIPFSSPVSIMAGRNEMCLCAFGNYWVHVNEELFLGLPPAQLNMTNQSFSWWKKTHQYSYRTLYKQIAFGFNFELIWMQIFLNGLLCRSLQLKGFWN